MSKHMTIINLACTITKLRKWGEAWKHSAESAQAATARMHQAHEAKMVEHRAAFGARTEADAKIIAGLREEVKRLQWENATMHKDAEDGYAEAIKVLGDPIALSKERDALRAEVAALQERLRASIARGDFAQMEVAALRPKYKVGDKLMSHSQSLGPEVPVTVQGIRVVYDCSVDGAKYECVVGHAERELILVATHDTEAGKAVAESAVTTEPVADEIKVGDVVEVFQKTGSCTFETDVGTRGTVLQLDDSCVDTAPLEGYPSPRGNHVALCDVRKVTT